VAAADRPRILAEWSAQLGAPVSETSLPFSAIRVLDAPGFCRVLHARLRATALVVGSDFRGGRDRATDATGFMVAAAAAGMRCTVVPVVNDDLGPVSSTRLRAALAAGEVAAAAAGLGRPHRLCGTVVRGEGRGRRIGVPTANLGERRNLAPGHGVYAAWAWLGGERIRAAVNIGRLPTVSPDHAETVEAHLLDWEGDCYGADLALEFVVRIREERRFAGLPELVTQIQRDVAAVRAALG
jgi:riboflavin kinase/FMN adenylyltransferase